MKRHPAATLRPLPPNRHRTRRRRRRTLRPAPPRCQAQLEFESRKDLVAIFGGIVRIEHNGEFPGLSYVLDNDGVLVTLFEGCVRSWAGARAVVRAGGGERGGAGGVSVVDAGGGDQGSRSRHQAQVWCWQRAAPSPLPLP